MSEGEAVAERLSALRAEVRAAAVAAGRAHDDITIVGASKFQPVEALVAAYDAGVRDFGENYANELRDKRVAFLAHRPDATDVRWHFIGKVQRGNANLIAKADLVHGVGSIRQVDALDTARGRGAAPLDVLIQVNVADEESKNGVALDDVDALAAYIRSLVSLRLVGLMTMPAFDNDDDDSRLGAAFGAVAAAAARQGLSTLSMGMSGDFAIAIAAGATMVRVGTRLFGPRPTP